MADNIVEVKFGANTAEFDAGAADAKEELANVGASVRGLTDLFLVLGGAATGSFREMGAGAREAGAQVKEAAESVKEFREAVAGIGEALIAAFAVEQISEFAEKMAETAESTYHTALTFGETTGEVQAFNAQMKALGIAPEAAVTSFGRLDRALTNARDGNKQMAETFKGLGIDIREPISQAELFEKTIQGLSRVQDIPTRIGDAMRLLGRNIQGVAPLLGLTAEQIEEAKKATEEYGAVNDEAAARGLALAESFNTNKVAMQGLNNVLTDALAPIFKVLVDGVNGLIKDMIDSYNAGGAVKQAFAALAATAQILITAISTLWTGFEQLFHTIELVAQLIMGPFAVAGVVLHDILSGKAGQAARDGEAAIRGWGAAMSQQLKAIETEGQNYLKLMHEVWSPPKIPELPKAATVPAGVEVKPSKQTGQETAMQGLREQLDQRVNEHNASIEDMAAVELKFWQDVQDGAVRTTRALNPREQAEVRMNILRLEHQEAMSQIRERMSAAKDEAAAQEGAIKDAAAQRKAAIDDQIKDVDDAEKRSAISHQQANAQIIPLYRQEQQAAADAANQIYRARIQADEFIKSKSDKTTTEYKAAQRDEVAAANDRNRQIIAANDNANRQIQQQNRRTLDEMRQQWHGYIDGTVQAMGNGIKGMIAGTTTFSQAMRSIGESILNVFTSIAERMAERWIVNMILGQAQTQASNAVTAASYIGVAGAAGVASMAAAPFPIDLTAPAFGASMAAAAAGYGVLASAAGGWGEVPYDGALTELHKQEMVLPATLANPLRSMLSNTSNDNRSFGGGDTHLHSTYAPQISGRVGSIREMMDSQHREFINGLEAMARGGKLHRVFRAAGLRAA